MLSATNVTKRYGKTTVLDAASLAIEPGMVTAVIGANGAGKSTLIKSVVGLIRFEGSITINGMDVARDGRRAREMVGYVLGQNTRMLHLMTKLGFAVMTDPDDSSMRIVVRKLAG